ncbi:MAG: FHA domain-containing protein [Chloroflexi bacterium]|nr:FHA domain-containing protein [Chloroflexota bacterium]
MAQRITTAMAYSSHHYATQLGANVTVGEMARYLAHYETRIEASTLEMARVTRTNQRLQDLDLQPGDRLVVFTQAAQPVDLPAPLRAGDRVLRLRLGGFELSSRGKRRLLIGRPDSGQNTIPDIDLRYFVPPNALDAIAGSRIWLQLQGGTWYASKQGSARVMLDDLELSNTPIMLNQSQGLRLYRTNDDPRSGVPPICDILIRQEVAQAAEDAPYLHAGQMRVQMRVGLENESQALKASENVSMGQLASSLAAYNQMTLTTDMQVCVMRLVPPQLRLDRLARGEETFLYTALNVRYARNLLRLRDIHNRAQVYVLSGSREDGEKLIGCRPDSGANGVGLDVDLYDSIVAQGHDPRLFNTLSPYYARILYNAADESWRIRLEERAHVPLFINNARVTSSAPVQLTSGDVISFGPSITSYYARLEVELSSQAE